MNNEGAACMVAACLDEEPVRALSHHRAPRAVSGVRRGPTLHFYTFQRSFGVERRIARAVEQFIALPEWDVVEAAEERKSKSVKGQCDSDCTPGEGCEA
jgi:hypothetical protein